LSCAKIHKKELDCDGIRDKTKFIPIRKMTTMDFMNDYYFLEEATRFTKEVRGNYKLKGTKKLNHKVIKLKKAAMARNIKLFLIDSSLTKRKRNCSCYNAKDDVISWFAEINFSNADFKITKKIDENKKLIDVIQQILEANSSNKQLEFYKSSKIEVLLKAEGFKKNQNLFHLLEIKKSLKSNLSRKVVIEYPVIYVVLSHCLNDFELVANDGKLN
jgi:hypothetical protein